MKMKRFLAMAMAGVLTLTPVTAFGADTTYSDPNTASGSVSGNGAIEAIVDKDVFNVVLPTYDSKIFDFKLDPQGVVADTNGDAYGGETTEASLFFVDPTANTLSSNSASISVYNKSSYDVDVALTAEASGLSTATLADSSAFSGENTDIYLALQSGDDTAVITADGASLSTTLGTKADSYEVKYDSVNKKYSYELTDTGAATTFPGMSFNLTGACNTAADWTALENIKPSVEVSWTISKHEEVTGPQVSMTSAGLVTITNLTSTAAVNAKAISTTGSTNTNSIALSSDCSWNTNNWTQADGGTLILQLGSSYLSYYSGQTVTISFILTDGSTISASAQF